jgi:hypothetical protein
MFTGVISTTMVLMLLGLVARNFIRNVKDPPSGGEWRLIRTHLDAYLLSLLGSEILQGIGAIMNVKWVLEGGLYCSDYCSVQGAVKTIGEAGVGMITTVSDGDRHPIALCSFGGSYCATLLMRSPRQSTYTPLLSSSLGGYQAHNQPGSIVLSSPWYGATLYYLSLLLPLCTALTSSYVLFSLDIPSCLLIPRLEPSSVLVLD